MFAVMLGGRIQFDSPDNQGDDLTQEKQSNRLMALAID
jgi:hypothetical protein